MASHNWLVHRIHDAALEKILKEYAHGVLLDVGCGEKPYAAMIEPLVERHIGLDHIETSHNTENIDILASAYDTTLPNEEVDTILCTAVLEHLERPLKALGEMYRVLRPGGYVVLSAPLFWHLHEQPRDFYRYTRYGLEYLFTEAGFEVVEIKPLSGFVVTFAQELCYFMQYFQQRPIRWLIAGMQFLIQWIAYNLDRWDRSSGFTWMYLVVARKLSR